MGSGGESHSLLSLPRGGSRGHRLPSPSTSIIEIPFWGKNGSAACLVFQITESVTVQIAPPSIFPAVVGKVVVAIVLEGDSATGAPKSMRTALWVVATPARALVAPRLLIPTPAAPPPHGENRLKNPPLMGTSALTVNLMPQYCFEG
jgi:hypothetical protein